MSSIRRFAIQRTDGAWYAGRGDDEAESWTDEPEKALIFERYDQAMESLNRLRREDHEVQLFGLG